MSGKVPRLKVFTLPKHSIHVRLCTYDTTLDLITSLARLYILERSISRTTLFNTRTDLFEHCVAFRSFVIDRSPSIADKADSMSQEYRIDIWRMALLSK